MAESKIESKMKNLNINQKTDINILLLGSTGVGKSTMINSFANYLTYGDLKQAKKDKLMVLIPSKLNIMDKYGEYHLVSTGDTDNNEYLETGESATQDVKTYVFPIWNGKVNIRLIDTPGMGDTRGVKQDDINSENILSYISNLHELHAICFLLKPNESRYTVFFKYCIDQIFSRLDKTASDNIIFCFTNTRGTDYSPGETVGVLKKTVGDIGNRPPFAKIPFDKNIFCFDNEPYRYLAAIKGGIKISSEIKQRNKDSWEKSAEQCWNMIKYIVGEKDKKPLKPHFVKSTNAINEARRMINQLSQPLAEIMQLIQHNMEVLSRHRELLSEDNASLEEMRSKLYLPVITLDVTQLDHPATVCTAKKCAEVITVAGKNCWNYKQRCHPHCYLTNVGKEQLGDPNLISCTAMNGTTTCCQCFCDYRVHMHVYYTTETVENQEKDENMQMKIASRSEVIENKWRLIRNIEQRQKELEEEHKIIVEICAKFAHFLQNNAITPFSDSYKEYIEYLIDREKSLGTVCNKETVKHLELLLVQYSEIKNRFDEALKMTKTIGRDELVSAKEINDSVQILYKLKHNGQKIRELYNCQKKARTKEFQHTEYVHKMAFKPAERKEDVKKVKKDRKYEEKKKSENKNFNYKQKQQQNKGNARSSSPPPSYQELQENQKTFRNKTRGFQNNFNQARPQSPNMIPPRGYPHGSQYQPMPQFVPQQGYPYQFQGQFPPQVQQFSPQGPAYTENKQYQGNFDKPANEYHINVTLKSTDDPRSSKKMASNMPHPNQPQTSQIPSLMDQNVSSPNLYPQLPHGMNFPQNYYQHQDFSWPSHSVLRPNEQGGIYKKIHRRNNRRINKRTRGNKGKGTTDVPKENRNKNEITFTKKGKKKNSSSSSESSSSSSSSD
ncbi:uncharacterized protein LOC130447025 [Diorhabda sublineata]|uniref:uncharacterized protein LOC130447025 n=1 Tax=Diorhabda sublineata TaxID=1163346 RepID=UPI0024E12CC7|nr:uncharacterized protein LOC130447025 [Diorhabda sublineata]XP_056639607.1 uncharacterized protein LOC130447025 [Diorhabda sublineata]